MAFSGHIRSLGLNTYYTGEGASWRWDGSGKDNTGYSGDGVYIGRGCRKSFPYRLSGKRFDKLVSGDKKFSDIDTYLVHGIFTLETFEKWKYLGGAAVTNFGTMGKIVDHIDDHMHLSMLIIDEACVFQRWKSKRICQSGKACRTVWSFMWWRQEGSRLFIFRETIDRVRSLLGSRCAGVICGTTPITERQAIIDRFSEAEEGRVLVCQVQSGGTELNIQAASVVIFCEPQILNSLRSYQCAGICSMGMITVKIWLLILLIGRLQIISNIVMEHIITSRKKRFNHA